MRKENILSAKEVVKYFTWGSFI